MRLVMQTTRATLYHGDCANVATVLAPESVDAIVTDPPAGIGFMGKSWDQDKGGRDAWIAWLAGIMRTALSLLKPGGHALVWALPRTSHWTATAIEDAGFEIRDVVQHLFGTGFPKSLDVSKAIDEAAGAERVVVGERKARLMSGHLDVGSPPTIPDDDPDDDPDDERGRAMVRLGHRAQARRRKLDPRPQASRRHGRGQRARVRDRGVERGRVSDRHERRGSRCCASATADAPTTRRDYVVRDGAKR